MLAEIYSPKSLNEFAGNRRAVQAGLEWLKRWPHTEERALLFAGPPGVGKTTLARLLAKERGLALVETNASDVRSAAALKEQFAGSLKQQTLFYKGRLLLFDEVDGLTAGDKGGAAELIKMVQESAHPVILVANDPYEKKLRGLRGYCKIVKFASLSPQEIASVLEKIAGAENVQMDARALEALARLSDGDLKGAINDFEYISAGKTRLTQEDVQVLAWRDITREIFETLKIIFKTTSAKTATEAIYQAEKDPGEILQWIRENLPLEYQGMELATAYNAVSRADVFRGRILSQQYWRFLAYTNDLMSAGVAVSKKEAARGFVKYQYPSRIIKLARTKAARAAEIELARALGKVLHCSRKEAQQYFPLLKHLEKAQPAQFESLSERLGKTPENVTDALGI